MPEAEVNDVPVWAIECGGGDPESDRAANEDSVADADCSIAGLHGEIVYSGRQSWNGNHARRSATGLPCVTHPPPCLAGGREATMVLHRCVDLGAASDAMASRAEAAGAVVATAG